MKRAYHGNKSKRDTEAAAIEEEKIQRGTFVICCCIIVLFVIGTAARNYTWGNAERLWLDIVTKSPDKLRGHINLGQIYQSSGRIALAEIQYRQTIELCDGGQSGRLGAVSVCDGARSNVASILLYRKDFAGAEPLLRKAIEGSPSLDAAKINLGVLYLRTGRAELALETLNSVKTPHGNDPEPEIEYNRGEALRMLGRCAEAQPHYANFKRWYVNRPIPTC